MTHIAGEVLQVVEARSEGFCILTRSGRVVVGSEDEFGHFGPISNHDDARRIVACVNACEGIPTDDLEDAKLIPMLDSYGVAIQQRDHLQAQVDELLAVLVNAKESLEHCYDVTDWPCNGSTDQDKAIAMAEASIKKITGETK